MTEHAMVQVLGRGVRRRATLVLGALVLAVSLIPRAGYAQDPPRLDVVFLLDATGSMGDEIDAVKERIREMIAQIAAGDPAPDVRFGIVAYRDRGDEYVTRVYELTRDIDRLVGNLDEIRADGGGDYPESLVEALHTVIHDLDWDMDPAVKRLVFLIADAPPHLDYPDDYDYVEDYQIAAQRGITVHALGASGLNEEGERVFREIAEGTGGDFQWLSYESRYIAEEDGEEVVVVVEGRTATYTKGDSTWTVEGGGMLGAAGDVRGAPGGFVGPEDGADEVPAASGDTGEEGIVETSTNLADLITEAVKDAAAESGVEYGGSTSASAISWGRVKMMVR